MPSPLIQKIQEIRQAIRQHRDQKGDDRCWLDDYRVWACIEGSPADPEALPSFEDGMEQCRAFFLHRRAEQADPLPPDAIQDPQKWNGDLQTLSELELQTVLTALQEAIQTHRDIHDRPRTLQDDRALYAILPEKIPADFRLPPEHIFLGEETVDVGCPAFWKSHKACPCKEHNLHAWGPCCKKS